MRYLVEIRADSAAFEDATPPAEVARILHELAGGISSDSSYGPVLDINGSTVGYAGWKA